LRIRHHFIKLEIPDEVPGRSVDEAALPTDWSRRITFTRVWGDHWLAECDTAFLVVRSVLVPQTYNVLVNLRHVGAMHVKRLDVMPYPLDSRLGRRELPGFPATDAAFWCQAHNSN
jgi:RES domain-containing protein